MKTTLTVKDAVTFKLFEVHLTGKKPNEHFVTLDRCIPCSGSAYKITNNAAWVQLLKLPHQELLPFFKTSYLDITCSVEFDIIVPLTSLLTPNLFDLCAHIATDFELAVGTDRLPVHKRYLSLISPVFNAMFLHDTSEARSGENLITDFDFDTVKTAINFCYGRPLEDPSVDTVIGILRFADKYDIKGVVNKLDQIPKLNLSTENFCTIVLYAYDCSKKELESECSKFYKIHHKVINENNKFSTLPVLLIVKLLKTAFDLKTNYDVLRHANKTGINSVMEHLEQPLIKSLKLKDFCSTVDYAWECSREDLMKACAEFLNKNRDEILELKEYYDLSEKVTHGVSKLGYTLKHN
uniref:BTB domain-containing protein n=1 Tax=Panagrellus redivivus TaxID=6233 RepID=A0A7E4W6M7_PANRE